MLTAGSEKNKSYPIEITQTDHPTRYAFSISQIIKEAEDYQLEITAKGNPAGIDRTQNKSILIPAKNSFSASCPPYASTNRKTELKSYSPTLYPTHRI